MSKELHVPATSSSGTKDSYKVMTTSGIMFSIAVVVLVSELCSGSGQSGVNQKVWETMIQTEYSTRILKPTEFKVSLVQGRDCTKGKPNSCKTMDSKCLAPFMSTRKPTSSAAATASCGSSALCATEIDTTDITDIQSDSLTSDSSSNKRGFVDLDLDLGSLGGRGGYEIPMKKAARFSTMGSMNSVDSFESQSQSSQSQVRLISGGASVFGRREHATRFRSPGNVVATSDHNHDLDLDSKIIAVHNNHKLRVMCESNLYECNRQHVIDKLHLAQKQRDDARMECKELKKQVALLERKNVQLAKKLENAETKHHQHDDLEISRVKVRLTARGTIALGVRKALALTSAVGFPLAALVNPSRWTVIRAEVSVWAALVSRARSFQKLFEEKLRMLVVWKPLPSIPSLDQNISSAIVTLEPSSSVTQSDDFDGNMCLSEMDAITNDFRLPQGVCTTAMCVQGNDEQFVLGGTEFCGDATNSSIWQNSKLCGMLVTSLYLVNPSNLNDPSNTAGFRSAFAWLRTLFPGIYSIQPTRVTVYRINICLYNDVGW